MATPPWIGLAGPTASGKTALALRLAEALAPERRLEVISVDSALVYRGMDIGTAKPSAAERAQLPHHLIDLLDPGERYSAAQFVRDAQRLIADIQGRGNLPLLVGGTMLYFKALMEGIDALPEADPTLRAALDAQAAQHGWPALHAELQRVDPVTAARLAPNDSQRIQRALEVWQLTGQPLSQLQRRTATPAAPASGESPEAPPVLLALQPPDRAWLHQRIAQRFAQMLDLGFLAEVQTLRARADLHLDLPAMRCVGYRQAWEALDQGLNGAALAEAVRERGVAATRQLAKRQLTWLRSLPCTALPADEVEHAVSLALPLLRATASPSPAPAGP